MPTVTSRDGTSIAFDVVGDGPPLVLVQGSFEHRGLQTETAYLAAFPLLRQHFRVIHYDRRGRGESGDTLPYEVAREIEDIEALIDWAGGSAFVSGISSGAALAFEAALALPGKVKAVALYEPPYSDDRASINAVRRFRERYPTAMKEGRRADAVGIFFALLGVPPDQLAGMRQIPLWPAWEAMAETFGYEVDVLGKDARVPVARAGGMTVPALIVSGETSWGGPTARLLADAIPGATYRELAGESHEVTPEALAPALVEFFGKA